MYVARLVTSPVVGRAPWGASLSFDVVKNASRGLDCALPLASSAVWLILSDLETFARHVNWLHMPTTEYNYIMLPWGALCPVVLQAAARSLMPPGIIHCKFWDLLLTGVSTQRSVHYTRSQWLAAHHP